jgi:hypothetical protein
MASQILLSKNVVPEIFTVGNNGLAPAGPVSKSRCRLFSFLFPKKNAFPSPSINHHSTLLNHLIRVSNTSYALKLCCSN